MPKPLRGRDQLKRELADSALRLRDINRNRNAVRKNDPPYFWVLHGMGGVGKTAVALSVARVVTQAGIPVFWIIGDSSASLEAGMREAALRASARRKRSIMLRTIPYS